MNNIEELSERYVTLLNKYSEYLDLFEKVSQKIGVTVRELSIIEKQLKENGIEIKENDTEPE